jgi:hypothetical protein
MRSTSTVLVKRSGPHGLDGPLIEPIMLGRMADAAISFTSLGRVVTIDP